MFMVYTNFEPPFKKNNFFLYNLNVNDNYKFKYFAINFINQSIKPTFKYP